MVEVVRVAGTHLAARTAREVVFGSGTHLAAAPGARDAPPDCAPLGRSAPTLLMSPSATSPLSRPDQSPDKSQQHKGKKANTQHTA
eukprot:scaffold8876_cov65-Phaeocystis_antarctica.AAC.1